MLQYEKENRFFAVLKPQNKACLQVPWMAD